jgi:hypothetical protein
MKLGRETKTERGEKSCVWHFIFQSKTDQGMKAKQCCKLFSRLFCRISQKIVRYEKLDSN